MRILLVDDDFVTLAKLNAILANYGEVQSATHSAQAVEYFEKLAKHGDNFDMMLVDIDLPDVDGISLLSRLRNLEVKMQVPSAQKLVITANANQDNVVKAIKAGFQGVLAKPLHLDVIAKKMKDLGLIKDFKAARTEKPTATPNALTTTTANEQKPDSTEPVEEGDPKAILKLKIREEKKELFKFCLKDQTMLHLLDVVCAVEAEKRLNDAGQ